MTIKAQHNSMPKFKNSLLCLVVAISAIVSVALTIPALKVLFSAFSVMCLGIILYRRIAILRPDLVSLRVFCLLYILQNFWLVCYTATCENTYIWGNLLDPPPDFGVGAYEATLPSLLIMLVLWLYTELIASRVNHAIPALIKRFTKRRSGGFGAMLIALNALFPAYFIAVKGFGVFNFTYIILFMQATSACSPFLVGLYWRQYKLSAITCIGLLCISTLLGFGEGSRTLIFMPFGFLAVGFLLSLSRTARRKVIILYVIASIPLFYIVGNIGNVREQVRQTLGDVSDNITLMYQLLLDPSDLTTDTLNTFSRGVWRMISWSNIAVPILTPSDFDYRGTDGILDEIRFNSQFLIFDSMGNFKRVNSDFGLGVASKYGFVVHEESAVPFGLIADSWSRAGWLGLALGTVILAVFFVSCEKLVWYFFGKSAVLFVIMRTIIITQVFWRIDIGSVISVIRYTLLCFVFWGGLLKVLSLMVPSLDKARHECTGNPLCQCK